MAILKQLRDATPKELIQIRQELHKHLLVAYKSLKVMNFRQLHFHLKDNSSFLRMHKPLKFSDDLTDVRYGVKFVNKSLKSVDGFEEGRVINGFRFIYPLIDKEKNHLGSVEISVSSKGFIEMIKQSAKK